MLILMCVFNLSVSTVETIRTIPVTPSQALALNTDEAQSQRRKMCRNEFSAEPTLAYIVRN
jgi:hypothetical protein